MNDAVLSMWIVYDHPRDMPHDFVARRWVVGNGHAERPTSDLIVSRELESLRETLADKGLVCVPRYPNDDPVVVEVWM